MNVRDEIYNQIVEGLAGGKFPIRTPEELLGSFPEGAATTCRSGNVEVTAGDAGKLLKTSDFPFRDAKQVAEVIVTRAGL